MNNKLLPYIREEGYCCLWAWLEANRAQLTSVLARETAGVLTLRALQQNRAKHRAKETACDQRPCCLKEKIRSGLIQSSPVRPRKLDDSGVER